MKLGLAALLAFLAILVTFGLWLEVYEKLDNAHPGVILRDADSAAFAVDN